MEQNTYKILLDERWTLEDLYSFSHSFSQIYSFVYCLDSDVEPKNRVRINRALYEYPWKGGFSYVNIYTVLANQVAPDDRPLVKSIQYASPGWMELFINVEVALNVANAIIVFSGAAVTAFASYKKIHKHLSDLKLNREKEKIEQVKLTQAQAKHMSELSNELAQQIGFKNLSELDSATQNPEVSLRLLLAHYRRMSTVYEYVNNGKVSLPLE